MSRSLNINNPGKLLKERSPEVRHEAKTLQLSLLLLFGSLISVVEFDFTKEPRSEPFEYFSKRSNYRLNNDSYLRDPQEFLSIINNSGGEARRIFIVALLCCEVILALSLFNVPENKDTLLKSFHFWGKKRRKIYVEALEFDVATVIFLLAD